MSKSTKKASAALVMETVPVVMRSMATEMRRRRPAELSPNQFRAMLFINHNEGISLTDFADFTGMSLSSASKIADSLACRRFVRREEATDDRRRILLSITPAGKKILEKAVAEAMEYFTKKLAPLTASECAVVSKAMLLLGEAFAPVRRNPPIGAK